MIIQCAMCVCFLWIMWIPKAGPYLLKARGTIFGNELATLGQVFSLFSPFAKELPRRRSRGCFHGILRRKRSGRLLLRLARVPGMQQFAFPLVVWRAKCFTLSCILGHKSHVECFSVGHFQAACGKLPFQLLCLLNRA